MERERSILSLVSAARRLSFSFPFLSGHTGAVKVSPTAKPRKTQTVRVLQLDTAAVKASFLFKLFKFSSFFFSFFLNFCVILKYFTETYGRTEHSCGNSDGTRARPLTSSRVRECHFWVGVQTWNRRVVFQRKETNALDLKIDFFSVAAVTEGVVYSSKTSALVFRNEKIECGKLIIKLTSRLIIGYSPKTPRSLRNTRHKSPCC